VDADCDEVIGVNGARDMVEEKFDNESWVAVPIVLRRSMAFVELEDKGTGDFSIEDFWAG
jgi:hypothetical protein